MKRFLESLLLLIFAGLLTVPARAAEPEPTPDFHSSGVLFKDELFAVGKVRSVEDDPGKKELVVEKVLFGCCTGDPVRFDRGGELTNRHGIYLLRTTRFIDHRSSRSCEPLLVEPADERAVLALGEARLDYETLAAGSIVVGKVTNGKEDHNGIEVVRVLKGPPLQAGLLIPIIGFNSRTSYRECQAEGPPRLGIYFLSEIDPNKKTTYGVCYSQPIDHEPVVRTALERSLQHPIVEEKEGNKIRRKRLVLFRGSIKESVTFLGSALESIASLGRDRLEYEQRRDATLLPRLIEQQLSGTQGKSREPYAPLRRLIWLLSRLQQEQKQTELLVRLVVHHFRVAGIV